MDGLCFNFPEHRAVAKNTMNTSSSRGICLQCRYHLTKRSFRRAYHESTRLQSEKVAPTTAPKQNLPVRHIRQNAVLHSQNCLERNFKLQSTYPDKIASLFEQWQDKRQEGRSLREHSKSFKRRLSEVDVPSSRATILEEARKVKQELSVIENEEVAIDKEIQLLASTIPNLTSPETPRGDDFKILGYINEHPDPDHTSKSWRSHVDIGTELSLIDLPSAATVSGSGWYYLMNEAALLEQALIQYSLSVALTHGFQIISPPSLVYNHILSACGFQPRDTTEAQQIYRISQAPTDRSPARSLAGTAEIPLAGMKANSTIDASELPMKTVAVSRCYRAEAGSHGIDTKGLYRVHEFTKVELFGWTNPSHEASTELFNSLVAIQTEILQSLNLHCRILEMSSTDLGASAYRKVDMEAYFPSRQAKDQGWGEVTSASECTDYQSRRLGTRVARKGEEKLEYAWTVNGTAMAVPRILAAILENGWDEAEGTVKIPEVLRPWMGGRTVIGPKGEK